MPTRSPLIPGAGGFGSRLLTLPAPCATKSLGLNLSLRVSWLWGQDTEN